MWVCRATAMLLVFAVGCGEGKVQSRSAACQFSEIEHNQLVQRYDSLFALLGSKSGGFYGGFERQHFYVLSTRALTPTEEAQIRSLFQCPVGFRVVKYSESELEALSLRVFSFQRDKRPRGFVGTHVDVETNKVVVESGPPLPEEYVERIRGAFPADAIRFETGYGPYVLKRAVTNRRRSPDRSD